MEELEEVIKAPKGYYISEESTINNIVLKKMEVSNVKTWEDLSNYNFTDPVYYISDTSVIESFCLDEFGDSDFDESFSNLLPSEEYAKAMLALMKLIMVRSFYTGDWIPNWKDGTLKYSICFDKDTLTYHHSTKLSRVLTFPTEDKAIEFLNNNRELILEAKIVL